MTLKQILVAKECIQLQKAKTSLSRGTKICSCVLMIRERIRVLSNLLFSQLMITIFKLIKLEMT